MICRNCGKEFEGKFCPYCGHDSSKPTKAEKASKRKESVDKAKEKMKPATDFVKKHKVSVIIVAAVLAIAIIVGTTLGVVLSNNFRVGKMNEIKIGMTKVEVEKKLGKPHEDEDSEWCYYSKDYKKLIDEANDLTEKMLSVENEKELEKIFNRVAKLEEEQMTLVHDEIKIIFLEDKVYSVEMRKDISDMTQDTKKEIKKARVDSVKRFTSPNFYYAVVEYTDGSYRHAPISIKERPNTEYEGNYNVTWHDLWSDTDVTAELKVVKNPDIYRQGKFDSGVEYFIFKVDGGYAVSLLGNGTFTGEYWGDVKDKLISVNIGNGVTSIGFDAFYGCSNLTSVEIPNSVTSIGTGAFSDCGSLVSVAIPNSVTNVGFGAFWECGSLTIYAEASTKPSGWDNNWNYSYCPVVWDYKNNEVASDGYIYTVQNGIRYGLKDGAATIVRQPSNLTEAKIPNEIVYGDTTYRVTSICESAFLYRSSLVSVVIPNSVIRIDSSAFRGCSSLESVVIGNGVTSIGSWAFRECSSLESVVIGNGVTSIGNSAFEDTGIWNNAADNSVVYADKWAVGYKGNKNSVTEITLRADTVGIGSDAFRECSSLVSVEIPNSVTSIGRWAFYECRNLTNIEYHGTKAEWKAIGKGWYWNNGAGNYTVTCTDGTLTESES